MTKRAKGKFKRSPRDLYRTPPAAVAPVVPHLPPGSKFSEPCAGDAALVAAMLGFGFPCCQATDIKPGWVDVDPLDALAGDDYPIHPAADFIITNPPWSRDLLHPMIDRFRRLRPTWLLFDADWFYTAQALPFLTYCHAVQAVGRVCWMGNGSVGFDNAAWYLFKAEPTGPGGIRLYPNMRRATAA